MKQELFNLKQLKTKRKLHRNNGGAVWHRVGSGKTRITYGWFAMIAKHCELRAPVFIVVCRRQAFYDWKQEAVKLGLPWIVCDYELYLGNKSARPRVFLVSHGMLDKLLDDLMSDSSMIQAIAYDEGYLYKNSHSRHSIAAQKISDKVGRAAILSGSIMTARNLEDVFGQMYAINQHTRLAPTLTAFRSKYMIKYRIGDAAYARFASAKGAKARVAKIVKPIASIHFPKSEREERDIVREIEPTDVQRDYMDRLRQEYYLEHEGKEIELKNAPAIITKCQQISDGWIRMSEGEDGIHELKSNKQDYLLGQVEELVACGERPIIWCAFRHTVKRILQVLQKRKIKAYGLTGGTNFDDVGWRRDGQVAVATEDSGSSFNHFRDCPYAIYYSMSFKWLALQQSKGRTNRGDSEHKICYYYFLRTKGSLDAFVHNTAVRSAREEKQLINTIELSKWLHQ